jgi:hypothetical protein
LRLININNLFAKAFMKKAKVKFSPESERIYHLLEAHAASSKMDRMLLKAINEKIELIKSDIRYGNPIAKDLIPKEYVIKYDVKNLFRVELPVFWRMLYTNVRETGEVEIVAFIVDILDHPSYDKKFGYKKR